MSRREDVGVEEVELGEEVDNYLERMSNIEKRNVSKCGYCE